LLPVFGTGAVTVEVQGRGAIGKGSMAPADLGDLISSIATVGMIHPVCVEERGPQRLLVAGERRLRAVRWGAVNDPDNPYFSHVPAVIAPGPLTEDERRTWQLAENLVRSDLQPGELGAGLLLERCAVLQQKLLAADVDVPLEVARDDDPVRRFRRLEGLRGPRSELAAPWSEVLARLGIQLSPRKAREVVAAFAALPSEVSAQMDAEGVSVWARSAFARLNAGRQAAAEKLWTAVRERGSTELLGSAALAAAAQPGLSVHEALRLAEEQHKAANKARRLRLSHGGDSDDELEGDEDELVEVAALPRAPAAADRPQELVGELVTAAIDSLRALLDGVRAGHSMDRYAAGSLRLLSEELLHLLGSAS
jgi:ParB family chromosome partitioning protein